MLIGYVRVSKSDGSQKLDLQKDALIKEGVYPERIYHDYASGAKDFRPGLEACLKALQPGNKLVIWKLDRLGRSTSKLLTFLFFVPLTKGLVKRFSRISLLIDYCSINLTLTQIMPNCKRND